MNKENFYEEAVKYLTGEMDNEERRAFEGFTKQDPLLEKDLETLQSLWVQTGLYDEDVEVPSVEDQWQMFSQKAFKEEAKQVQMLPSWKKQLSRVAAVLLIISGTIFTWKILLQPSERTVTLVSAATSSERKMVSLPDGSKVWMNSNSSISYDEEFSNRVVNLEGEAYFEVVHLASDAQFQVVAGDARTTVLGTAFNVRAYPDDDKVSVYVEEGKVSFSEKVRKQEVILEAGSTGSYMVENHLLRHMKGQDANDVAWKTGFLDYEDEELAEILDDLVHLYDISFEVENQAVLFCTYNTTFDNTSLDDILGELEFGLKLKITKKVDDRHFIISGKGCQEEQ